MTDLAIQTEAVRGKRQRNREQNKRAMLNAFESILVRDGIHNLRTQTLMDEAGLGKPALYSYFGGMSGLLKAWLKKNPLWPQATDLVDGHEYGELDRLPVMERIRLSLIGAANHWHENEAVARLMAEELSGPTPFSKTLAELRRQKQDEVTQDLASDAEVLARDNWRILVVLYAAVSFASMRRLSNTQYLNLELHTDEGWKDFLSMISELIDDLALAATVKQAARESVERQESKSR